MESQMIGVTPALEIHLMAKHKSYDFNKVRREYSLAGVQSSRPPIISAVALLDYNDDVAFFERQVTLLLSFVIV